MFFACVILYPAGFASEGLGRVMWLLWGAVGKDGCLVSCL